VAASTSPSLFLRVAQPPLSKPAKTTAKASALLPAPVTARLRALAVTLVGVGQSPCVKVRVMPWYGAHKRALGFAAVFFHQCS
jgi:hypothetical protein